MIQKQYYFCPEAAASFSYRLNSSATQSLSVIARHRVANADQSFGPVIGRADTQVGPCGRMANGSILK
ncbi:MAG: hypothetical protein J6Z30_07950 [Pyramidobacter sp.]|nr:hypothetical protein [Pyramidobacter sp.]